MRYWRLLLLGLSVVAILVIQPSGPSLSAATDAFVTRNGTQLLLNGQPYRFTGLNIYNANSDGWCWYAMNSGSALDEALTSIGPGKNAMRAWFFQRQATSRASGVRDWSAFDHTLSVARAHGVKVVATLANQWVDCEPDSGYKDTTWYQSRYQDLDPGGTVSYRDWVAEIVTRYRDDPTILAWQLINEAEIKDTVSGGCPAGDPAGVLKTWATDVSGLIKSIDPNHLVSLGTIGGCGAQYTDYQYVHDIPTIDLCEYHDYQPNAAMPGGYAWSGFQGLQVRIDQCNALNKPIFIGEVGMRPIDVPPGFGYQDRAAAFEAKVGAQFSAGIVGMLAWTWSNLGSTLDNYNIGPGDPVLDVLAIFIDSDGDGCADSAELQTAVGSEETGGLRNAKNPDDFYDTNGDKVIDLFNDIFNVAFAFGLTPADAGYSVVLDRSAAAGGTDVWDMGAPDGTIDLFTDIFGVAYQFGHDCS